MGKELNSAVRLEGVSKAYADTRVIHDLSLSFPEGQITAVVGESGSGKTTLLRLINGVQQPDSGSVTVLGQTLPAADPEHFRRSIGYAVQGAGLFPHLSARRNVVLLAELEDWSEADIDARFRELLEAMELHQDLADRYPHQLSGGQQQRFGLCRALMLKPRLLLLDEPFTGVDVITRSGIYGRFKLVQQDQGVTALLVTHDIKEAVHLGNHLVILHAGKVLRSGPVDQVLADPGHEHVEKLMQQQL